MKHSKAFILAFAMVCAFSAHAEVEFSSYGGIQSSPHSKATGPDGQKFWAGWQGKSLEVPLYYGFRVTNWTDEKWGWNVNFVHAKAYSDQETRTKSGYSTLEFTDGANPLTVNLMRRYNKTEFGITPYTSVGAGFSMPHVELAKPGLANDKKTFEFQFGGPVLAASAGFTYPINDKFNLMTEFSMHYLMLNVKMNGEDGRFKTNLITNALNIGVNYKF